MVVSLFLSFSNQSLDDLALSFSNLYGKVVSHNYIYDCLNDNSIVDIFGL